MEIVNAKITGTMLGIEDHGILTFFVHVEWGGCLSQGIGGYALDMLASKTDYENRIGFAPGLIAIRKILEVVGVEKWEDLKGKLVRLKFEGLNCPLIIGNILEDRWFDLKEFMRANS